MSQRLLKPLILILLGLTLALSAWLAMPQPQASAQCGKTASSCKTCHETQGKLRVNTQGEWHIQHAFGDFCVYCHAGDVKAKDKTLAHKGMIKPLADVTFTCATCHTDDCDTRAQRYASVLGVTAGEGGSGATAPMGPAPLLPFVPRMAGTGDTPSPFQQPSPSAQSGTLGSEPGDNMRTVNWGNVILTVLALALLFGGGGFAVWNERRLLYAAQPTGWDRLIGARPELGEVMPLLAKADAQTVKAIARTLAERNK